MLQYIEADNHLLEPRVDHVVPFPSLGGWRFVVGEADKVYLDSAVQLSRRGSWRRSGRWMTSGGYWDGSAVVGMEV